MANAGPATNKSQFFITFRSCKHLDNKHTIFGKVVGGLETLSKMESVQTDEKDRPIEDIVFLEAHVFVDPYKEAEKMIENERAKAKSSQDVSTKKVEAKPKTFRTGVGAFINLDDLHKRNESPSGDETSRSNKKIKSSFGNFANW